MARLFFTSQISDLGLAAPVIEAERLCGLVGVYYVDSRLDFLFLLLKSAEMSLQPKPAQLLFSKCFNLDSQSRLSAQ